MTYLHFIKKTHTNVKKQSRYFRDLGGVKIFFSFFLILAINMQNQKKWSKEKSFGFLIHTFWEKNLSHFVDFVDFRQKICFFGGAFFFLTPPPIFQNKNFWIISTVRIFQFDHNGEKINDQTWYVHMRHKIYSVEVRIDFQIWYKSTKLTLLT